MKAQWVTCPKCETQTFAVVGGGYWVVCRWCQFKWTPQPDPIRNATNVRWSR